MENSYKKVQSLHSTEENVVWCLSIDSQKIFHYFLKMQSSDDSICCKLCSEIYEDPLVLHCGHSICKKCAEASLAFNKLRKSTFDVKNKEDPNLQFN